MNYSFVVNAIPIVNFNGCYCNDNLCLVLPADMIRNAMGEKKLLLQTELIRQTQGKTIEHDVKSAQSINQSIDRYFNA